MKYLIQYTEKSIDSKADRCIQVDFITEDNLIQNKRDSFETLLCDIRMLDKRKTCYNVIFVESGIPERVINAPLLKNVSFPMICLFKDSYGKEHHIGIEFFNDINFQYYTEEEKDIFEYHISKYSESKTPLEYVTICDKANEILVSIEPDDMTYTIKNFMKTE